MAIKNTQEEAMSRSLSGAPAHSRRKHCRALLVSAVALVFASGAIAASPKASRESDGKKLPAKVRFIDSPSSESPAARKKRLKTECKGRPNAGACLGMTR